MDFLGLLAGLAMFLFGMHVMGDGLAKASNGKLERILEKLTSKKILAVLLGAGVTAVIQSSSATTVMVVGFVNSGIMKLQQAVGIIMGANIGTTMTSWLLSLMDIEGGNFFVQMLKPTSFSPILAIIGIFLIMTSDSKSRKYHIGAILIGFAILMFGMDQMSTAVKPLRDNEQFTSILTAFSNPILGMIAGAVLTAVIQSSSASVGILQALCATGAINFGMALPIIMGQNIGTCITALMSAFGASKNAKRASMIHLYFNLIGTIIFMVVFYGLNTFIKFEFLNGPADATGIAIVHSLFNIGCSILWFPFSNFLVKLATWTIRDKATEKEEEREFAILDERFLEQPSYAIELCRETASKMAETAKDSLYLALEALRSYSDDKIARVKEMEDKVDRYEDALGTYLLKLSEKDMTSEDNRTLSVILHSINDFERISDHAVNITDSAVEMHQKGLSFSENALQELDVFSSAVHDVVTISVDAFVSNDLELAKTVEPLEQVVNKLNTTVKQRHVKRLRKGKCTIELGLILQDIITNFERVSDHCSNIAVYLREKAEDNMNSHEYLHDWKEHNVEWFNHAYVELVDKYALPDSMIDDEETIVAAPVVAE